MGLGLGTPFRSLDVGFRMRNITAQSRMHEIMQYLNYVYGSVSRLKAYKFVLSIHSRTRTAAQLIYKFWTMSFHDIWDLTNTSSIGRPRACISLYPLHNVCKTGAACSIVNEKINNNVNGFVSESNKSEVNSVYSSNLMRGREYRVYVALPSDSR